MIKRKAHGAAGGFANTALRIYSRDPGIDLSRQGLLCSLILANSNFKGDIKPYHLPQSTGWYEGLYLGK